MGGDGGTGVYARRHVQKFFFNLHKQNNQPWTHMWQFSVFGLTSLTSLPSGVILSMHHSTATNLEMAPPILKNVPKIFLSPWRIPFPLCWWIMIINSLRRFTCILLCVDRQIKLRRCHYRQHIRLVTAVTGPQIVFEKWTSLVRKTSTFHRELLSIRSLDSWLRQTNRQSTDN